MSANYVAKELGYGVASEWAPFDAATNAAFEPLETFASASTTCSRRSPASASTRSISGSATSTGAGRRRSTSLRARGSRSPPGPRRQLAGGVRHNRRSGAACRLANDLDVDLIAGVGDVVHRDRAGAVAVLEGARRPLRPGEPSRENAAGGARCDRGRGGRARRRGRHGLVGDSEYDPVAAIDELSDRLFHVHLKDVEAPHTHVCCMHGEGCANIAAASTGFSRSATRAR